MIMDMCQYINPLDLVKKIRLSDLMFLLYNLQYPITILNKPLTKEAFKSLVRSKVIDYWENFLRQEASFLPSLGYFNPNCGQQQVLKPMKLPRQGSRLCFLLLNIPVLSTLDIGHPKTLTGFVPILVGSQTFVWNILNIFSSFAQHMMR